jgi:hypothetical protein
VEAHGGKMWVESHKGRGTTFFFRLPIGEIPFTETEVSRWVSPFSSYQERAQWPAWRAPIVPPRLIVLETDQLLSRFLKRYLHQGAEVVSVSTLSDAIEEAARTPAQALLVNANNVADELRQIEEKVALPFGLLTLLCSLPGSSHSVTTMDVSDYMVKPIFRQKLLTVLENLRLQGKTILVVDDDPDALRLFRRMLSLGPSAYKVLERRTANKH